MILCDIGNTHFHFYHKGRIWRETLQTLTPKTQQIYYISVNPDFENALLLHSPTAINLKPYFNLQTNYQGLGIDRIAVCEGISNGVIVDAGSAITIDILKNNQHLGGYILVGISQYIQSFSAISKALSQPPNLAISLQTLPQNTQEAMGWGMLQSIILLIKETAKNQQIYFCGGDGKFLSKFFPNSLYNELLVFQGMQKALQRYQNG